MRTDLISVNGEILPFSEYKLSARDRAFLYGDGVYAQIPVYAGSPFMAADLLDRLMNDCVRLHIPMVLMLEELCVMLKEFLDAAEVGGEDALVYCQVSRGVGGEGLNPPETNIPELTMQLRTWNRNLLKELRETGVKLHVAEDKRGEMCSVHSTCRLGEVLARAEARRARLYDALFVTADGKITEATEAGFYVLKDGLLWTHPQGERVHENLLARILKEKLAPQMELTVLEKPFTIEFALSAEEAFICAPQLEFLPVTKLARKNMPTKGPGKMTIDLQAAYEKFVAAQLKL